MIKKLLIIVLLGTLNYSCMAMFKKGDKCKLVFGYEKHCNETIIIEGIASDMFGVDNIETLLKNKRELVAYPSITIYLTECIKKGALEKYKGDWFNMSINDLKEDHKGVFYYGKIQGRGFCFHPTWLEKIEDNAS